MSKTVPRALESASNIPTPGGQTWKGHLGLSWVWVSPFKELLIAWAGTWTAGNIHSPWALVGARHLSKHLWKPALEEGREQGRGTAKKILSGIAVLLKTKRRKDDRRRGLQLELKVRCFSATSLKQKMGNQRLHANFINTIFFKYYLMSRCTKDSQQKTDQYRQAGLYFAVCAKRLMGLWTNEKAMARSKSHLDAMGFLSTR